MAMNRSTAKRLEELMNRLHVIRVEFEAIEPVLEGDIAVLQESYDAKSERWQESDSGQTAKEVLDKLDEAYLSVGGITNDCLSAYAAIKDALSITE